MTIWVMIVLYVNIDRAQIEDGRFATEHECLVKAADVRANSKNDIRVTCNEVYVPREWMERR